MWRTYHTAHASHVRGSPRNHVIRSSSVLNSKTSGTFFVAVFRWRGLVPACFGFVACLRHHSRSER